MKIKEKIHLDYDGLSEHGPITIVAFGDSITHGAFGAGEFDYDHVYWNQLRKKINEKNPCIPVNVINAGVAGATAKHSLVRMEKQVLAHSPDLVIVCFGLNDVNGTLEDYINSLEKIFKRVLEKNIDLIFLTPNMLNTYVAKNTPPRFLEYAKQTAEMQNQGRMDTYIQSATALARKMGVAVCDCYTKWKEMSKTQDTTRLLANGINHPTREMHTLFAEALFQMIFEDEVPLRKMQ